MPRIIEIIEAMLTAFFHRDIPIVDSSKPEKIMRIVSAITSAALFALITVPPAAFADEGSELYNYFACNNCHGTKGKDPVSKVVPKIGGESSEHIYTEAKKILSGKGDTKESKIMHSAFYSPSNCDSPPTDEQLKTIAMWLSEQ